MGHIIKDSAKLDEDKQSAKGKEQGVANMIKFGELVIILIVLISMRLIIVRIW